jgi:hypothetical protein
MHNAFHSGTLINCAMRKMSQSRPQAWANLQDEADGPT